MELLVHASTYGHLLVDCSSDFLTLVALYGKLAESCNVHVILLDMLPAHLLLWDYMLRSIGNGSSFQMLHSEMATVMVVAHAASSIIHHGSQRT